MAYELKDYVEVADRIRAWYAEYPAGRIITSIIEFTDSRVTIRADVYRSPGEPACGVGHSFLAIPGSTPYTRGSELENAETSAVGRALVMAGIPAKNVASTDEVRGKRVDGPTTAPASADLARSGAETTAQPGRNQGGPSATSAGAEAFGEGAKAPAVDLDALELMQLAVKAHGNSLKALMAHVRAAHTEWEIRSVSDLTEGQMAVLVDCEHAA